LGKILLASLSSQQLEDFLYDGDFIALTPQTITSIGSLRSEIAAVRQRGYAVDNRKVYQTICCVGAPIRDPDGHNRGDILCGCGEEFVFDVAGRGGWAVDLSRGGDQPEDFRRL
jgi:DNA-binding IclR family transcriptional regulator